MFIINKRAVGSIKEDAAVNYLVNNGFTILERNFFCKIGEIDIIALRNQCVHFIEVKYRKTSDYGYALEAVSTKKQKKIYNVAKLFIAKNKNFENCMCSFDVIAIDGNNINYYYNCYGAI